MKIIAGIFGGLVVAILGRMVVSIAFAAFPVKGTSVYFGAAAFFTLWVASIAIASFSKSAPKAWRRLLLASAVMSFLLPLAGVVFTGSSMVTHVDPSAKYADAAMAGTAIGGGLVTGVLGFVGFFLGLIFLVIGLLVGRDKQIVYVQAPPASTPASSADSHR